MLMNSTPNECSDITQVNLLRHLPGASEQIGFKIIDNHWFS